MSRRRRRGLPKASEKESQLKKTADGSADLRK
jgi:hypothetical protein